MIKGFRLAEIPGARAYSDQVRQFGTRLAFATAIHEEDRISPGVALGALKGFVSALSGEALELESIGILHREQAVDRVTSWLSLGLVPGVRSGGMPDLNRRIGIAFVDLFHRPILALAGRVFTDSTFNESLVAVARGTAGILVARDED